LYRVKIYNTPSENSSKSKTNIRTGKTGKAVKMSKNPKFEEYRFIFDKVRIF
jgi:hypothetical protein